MASPSAAAAAVAAAGSPAAYLGEVQAEGESLATQVAATKVVEDTGTDTAERRKAVAEPESLQAASRRPRSSATL